jgi:hypothetical protein
VTHEQFLTVFAACEAAFHRNWSADVGCPGYNKRAWQNLHNALIATWRDRATAIGIPRDRPLVVGAR